MIDKYGIESISLHCEPYKKKLSRETINLIKSFILCRSIWLERI